MKKLLFLIVMKCICHGAYSQVQVFGRVVNSIPDTIDNAIVYIYSDTSISNPVIPLRRDTTAQKKGYEFFLPPIPNNTTFYVSTLNCDSQTMLIDTLVYTGQLAMFHDLVVCILSIDSFAGYVYMGGPTKRPLPQQAMVYLIQRCPGGSVTFIDSVETGTNGYYSVDTFPKLPPGCELVLQARLLPSSAFYKKYLPAYRISSNEYSLRWYGGKSIRPSTNSDTMNILLPEAMNPTGGPSMISGYAVIDSLASVYPDKILMITDMFDVPVDYTYTDTMGRFSFPNLPFGRYKVFGDVWHRYNPDLEVMVHADHVHETSVIFAVDSTKFWGRIATSVPGEENLLQQLYAYPNPAADRITIHGSAAISGKKQLVLYNISGAVLMQQQFDGNSAISIAVTGLAQGIYILKLNTEAGSSVFRIVK